MLHRVKQPGGPRKGQLPFNGEGAQGTEGGVPSGPAVRPESQPISAPWRHSEGLAGLRLRGTDTLLAVLAQSPSATICQPQHLGQAQPLFLSAFPSVQTRKGRKS